MQVAQVLRVISSRDALQTRVVHNSCKKYMRLRGPSFLSRQDDSHSHVLPDLNPGMHSGPVVSCIQAMFSQNVKCITCYAQWGVTMAMTWEGVTTQTGSKTHVSAISI